MAGFSVPVQRVFYQGALAVNAKIYVYATGTTTPVTIYSDGDLTTPVANPISTDSNGEAKFYVSTTNAIRLYTTTSGGTFISDIDPVYPIPPLLGTLVNGQCRLVKSGANLTLLPLNGNKLVVNGSIQAVTSPSLSASGLTPGTTYFIYAYMNSGTMTLEASTTTHTRDSSSGVEIKSGDATRSLVGMARCITGPAWADTDTQRLVASWFNRRPATLANAFTTGRTTTSTSFVEINSEIRCEFMTWGDSGFFGYSGGATNNNTGSSTNTAIGLDGVGTIYAKSLLQPNSGGVYKTCAGTAAFSTSEGYHYVTLAGRVDSTTTGTWLGGSGDGAVSLTGMVSI